LYVLVLEQYFIFILGIQRWIQLWDDRSFKLRWFWWIFFDHNV